MNTIPPRYVKGKPHTISQEEWERMDPTMKADTLSVHRVMLKHEKREQEKKDKRQEKPKKRR